METERLPAPGHEQVRDQRPRRGRVQARAGADDGRADQKQRVVRGAGEGDEPGDDQRETGDEKRLAGQVVRESAARVLAERVQPPQRRERHSRLKLGDSEVVHHGRQKRREDETAGLDGGPPERDGE